LILKTVIVVLMYQPIILEHVVKSSES